MESAAATIVSRVTTPAEKAGRQLQEQAYICYNKYYYYSVMTLCMAARQAAALFCFSGEVKGERRILAKSCMRKKELLYAIKPSQQTKESLLRILSDHKEVKYVSLMGVDLAGNDTDEKIPINIFLEDLDKFLNGSAAQTDGSSVVLPGIATLNDARVDMEVDRDVNWYVDYNYEHFDDYGNMVGTLRLPCFLIHNGDYVDSRSILKKTLTYVETELLALFKQYPHMPGLEKLNVKEIEHIIFTTATELEFWVKSPSEHSPIEALSSSQVMQEMYWQRTRGNVRTALEQSIEMLEWYGLEPEMGHKECGGVKGQIDADGHMTHINEQLEVDWKYSVGLQTADNEILARIVIKELFRLNGLDISFQAKPIPGVAGSGEHTHVGIAAKMKNGKVVNLFAPSDMDKDFLSALGYGALMGILKNYEAVNPFISATTDSFNRLKPGFEAPVCVVTSLGLAPKIPSRNRTILAGLIRDLDNPLATRIEMRSPNPYTNTYIAIAAFYLAALDGIKACVAGKYSLKQLEKEISKKTGEKGFYLEQEREYRTEEDVFEAFTAEERSHLFGEPPATVWENMQGWKKFPEKKKVIMQGDIFNEKVLHSFGEGALIRWKTELINRLIPEVRCDVISAKKLHDEKNGTAFDDAAWEKVQEVREKLAKDAVRKPCIFTQIQKGIETGDYATASAKFLEMQELQLELHRLYHDYKQNIID
ncbi:MAG: glutamine synthetase [Succiniclasticum sp.]|nr:glutamine synthetase [Succiniclasticum sp.]